MRISIKILGSGCAKCKNLERITREVAEGNYPDAEVSKVEDIAQIMNYGVMATPALVLNEKVVISGRVPSKEEIRLLIEKANNI